MDTRISAFARSARLVRSYRSIAESVVRVITTRAPSRISSSRSARATARLASASLSPVGPVLPCGGCPGSTAMVRPASGRARSMTGGRRISNTRSLLSHRVRHPNTRDTSSNVTVHSSADGCAQVTRRTSESVPPYCTKSRSDCAPYRRTVMLRSSSSTRKGTRASRPNRASTSESRGVSRTRRTRVSGGGVPAGSTDATSARLTHARDSRDNRTRTWPPTRPSSAPGVPSAKNQLNVPCGDGAPTTVPRVLPVRAVSSSRITTGSAPRSTRATRSGSGATRVSAPREARTAAPADALSVSGGTDAVVSGGSGAPSGTAGTVPTKRMVACAASRPGRRSNGPYVATGSVSGARGKVRPSGNRTATDAPGAARASTRIGSPLCAHISPRGRSEPGSSHSAWSGGTKRGGSRTRQSSDTRWVPLSAARWKTATVSSGSGSQARNAPSGATSTGAPLIVSRAAPLPVAPNRKELSRAPTTASAGGYTTVIASGPSTGWIAGRGCGWAAGASWPSPAVGTPTAAQTRAARRGDGRGRIARATYTNPQSNVNLGELTSPRTGRYIGAHSLPVLRPRRRPET